MANHVLRECKKIGLKAYTLVNEDSLAKVINKGWELFLNDPKAFWAWEEEQLKLLFQDENFSFFSME